MSLRIEGIYDQRTFKVLKELGFTNFSFNFCPLALNFFPQHRFLDLLSENFDPSCRFFLHYSREKDFVIHKMIDDLKCEKRLKASIEGSFYLEFSDEMGCEFYDQFKIPYYWHYQEGRSFKEILQGKHLKGIIFPYSMLEDLSKSGKLSSFLQFFYQLFHQVSRQKTLEIFLTVDWDFNMLPSLFDNLDIDCLSLPINQSIEVCYRNVDLEKMKKNLHFFQKSFLTRV